MFSWKDFVQLADEIKENNLAGNALEEAYQRTAVSRAYYGVFHIAMEYAEKQLPVAPYQRLSGKQKGENHRKLPAHLINYGQKFKDTDVRAIGTYLDTLRDNRNRCDYDNPLTQVSRVMGQAMKDAQDIISILKNKGFTI